MAHTYTNLLFHFVFSTKGRQRVLTPECRDALFPYMAGILGNRKSKALIINGVEDHIHVLCYLAPTISISDAVKSIKAGSSTWHNKQGGRPIHWQEGYAAFTVSHSKRDAVYRYIQNQQEHHRTVSFAEEYEMFLRNHNISFDRRFYLDQELLG